MEKERWNDKDLIFCPVCESRSVSVKQTGVFDTFRCTREACKKEFRVKR